MINLKADIKGVKEFNRVMQDYAQFTRRSVPEIINAKLYFVDLQSQRNTKKADPANILSKLRAPAEKYPDAPLECVLVNKQLAAKGKKGLTGEAMKQAVEKLEKKSVSRLGFVASTWIAAMKQLDYWNRRGDISFVKRFAPKRPAGLKQYGTDKSNAVPANTNSAMPRMWGKIRNFAGRGKQASDTIKGVILDGLTRGVAEEIRSMRQYIEKKFAEKIAKVNRTKTI